MNDLRNDILLPFFSTCSHFGRLMHVLLYLMAIYSILSKLLLQLLAVGKHMPGSSTNCH
jgi:hypothetical protein